MIVTYNFHLLPSSVIGQLSTKRIFFFQRQP